MHVRSMPLGAYNPADGYSDLAGFNPLKAIGRALGGVGRAVVSAIPGVGGVVGGALEAAARMPADKSTPVAQVLPAAVQSAAAATPAGQSASDALLTSLLTKLAAPQQLAPAAAQPSPVVVTNVPASAPAGGAGAMPSWAIPAMIAGGLGVMMIAMQNRR